MKVKFEPARKVEINGKEYEIVRSDFEVYAVGQEALKRCMEIDTNSAESVCGCISWMCDQINYVLRGDGTETPMHAITGGAPVTINGAMTVISHISSMCGKGYAARVERYVQPD